ncbi:MAG: endonuclease/exonuclease/phosphatase family protein [Phycisphaerae bacterium]|nr:endonuclease/exonuclease/phosphatase family protein [Phycisphaerae bacterium]
MKRCMLLLSLSIPLLLPTTGYAADEAVRPLPEVSWKDAAEHIGEKCVVVGEVVLTKNIGSMCFLNFHQDFKTNFTAVIKRKSYDLFPEPPENLYAGKMVRISGKIIEYNGKPEIIITSPDQIEIVDAAGVPTPAEPSTPQKPQQAPPAPRVVVPPFAGIVTVASYNTLNLFDDHDDPYHRDEGTPAKPSHELQKLADTIRKVNADVIALQEVENRGHLQQFNQTLLSDLGYKHVVLYEGNDTRGIDVAVLSRLPVGPVTSYRHMNYENPNGRKARFRRDLIRVRIEPPQARSFDVYVVHFKSKRGGEAAAVVRVGEATAAREILDQVLRDDPKARFVFCGDLNDTIDSPALHALLGSGPTALQCFYQDIPKGQRDTFNKKPYRDMIDFILCSPEMARHYQAGSYKVYPGTVQTSGSDHNPISARFDMR